MESRNMVNLLFSKRKGGNVLCTSTWEITILENGIRKNPLPFLLLAPLPVSKFHLLLYGQYG